MQSYPVGIEETKKILIADASKEGPTLTPAARAAQHYLHEEQRVILTMMQMSILFIELLAKPWEEFIKEL